MILHCNCLCLQYEIIRILIINVKEKEKVNGYTRKSLKSEEGGMATVYYAETSIGKRAAAKE